MSKSSFGGGWQPLEDGRPFHPPSLLLCCMWVRYYHKLGGIVGRRRQFINNGWGLSAVASFVCGYGILDYGGGCPLVFLLVPSAAPAPQLAAIGIQTTKAHNSQPPCRSTGCHHQPRAPDHHDEAPPSSPLPLLGGTFMTMMSSSPKMKTSYILPSHLPVKGDSKTSLSLGGGICTASPCMLPPSSTKQDLTLFLSSSLWNMTWPTCPQSTLSDCLWLWQLAPPSCS